MLSKFFTVKQFLLADFSPILLNTCVKHITKLMQIGYFQPYLPLLDIKIILIIYMYIYLTQQSLLILF